MSNNSICECQIPKLNMHKSAEEHHIDKKLQVYNKNYEAKFYYTEDMSNQVCCQNMRAKATNLKHCWVMSAHVDLVAFKPFNDQFNYAFGDGVLKAFCEVARSFISTKKHKFLQKLSEKYAREADVSTYSSVGFDSDKADIAFYRHGGEEFTILLQHERFCEKLNHSGSGISKQMKEFLNEAQLRLDNLCADLYNYWKNYVVLKVWINNTLEGYEYEVQAAKWEKGGLKDLIIDPLESEETNEKENMSKDKNRDRDPDFYLSSLCMRFGVAQEEEFYSRKSAENMLKNPQDDMLNFCKMYTDIERGVVHEETRIHFGKYERGKNKGIRLIDHAVLFWIPGSPVSRETASKREDEIQKTLITALKELSDPLERKISSMAAGKLVAFYRVELVTFIVIKTFNIVRVSGDESDNALGDMFMDYQKNKLKSLINNYKEQLKGRDLPENIRTLVRDIEKTSGFLTTMISNTKYRLELEKILREKIRSGIASIVSNDIRFLDLEKIE